MPVVSVIIPTYNRAHSIARSLQSVLDQTYKDFEVIVVDDGSTDGTDEIIKNFNDKRLTYIRHEQNRGQSAALNTGIKASRGEYIAFQDSDDVWHENKLEKQMEVFKTGSPDIGVVFSECWEIKDGVTKHCNKHINHEGDMEHHLEWKPYVIMPTVVMKKTVFDDSGLLDESIMRHKDWELWIRIPKYYRFVCVHEPLVTKYVGADSISSNAKLAITSWNMILKKHYKEFSKNRGIIALRHLNISRYAFSNKYLLQGIKYFLRAFITDPLAFVYYLPSLFTPGVYPCVTLWDISNKKISHYRSIFNKTAASVRKFFNKRLPKFFYKKLPNFIREKLLRNMKKIYNRISNRYRNLV